MRGFEIHPRLQADCHLLGRLDTCHLLLHRNAVMPWFILVPETGVVDLLDLPSALRHRVLDEAAAVSGFVKQTLRYPRVNVAAIGNLVPQLHVHVVGRRPGDSCWPAPVWGHLTESRDYCDTALITMRTALEQTCGLTE